VIRRISGRTVGGFFHQQVAEPLALRAWIGLPESEEPKIAPIFSTLPPVDPDAALAQPRNAGVNFQDPLVQTVLTSYATAGGSMDLLNSRAAHAAEVPAGNGISNARSLARMYAAIIGEVDGIRLLTPQQAAIAATPQTDALRAPGELAKLPEHFPLRFTLGYETSRTGVPMLGEGCFGHTGQGGRLAFADPVSGTAVGYTVTNSTWQYDRGPDPRWTPWTDALRTIVG
jgi:beta-lactamase family protein